MTLTPSFELFQHTADIGIRAVAATKADIIVQATLGLYNTIGELYPDPSSPAKTFIFKQQDEREENLLRDFLAEALFSFENERRLLTLLQINRFENNSLDVTSPTALIDGSKSIYYREVKAITYHELHLRTIPGGFEATVIVDI